MREDIKKIHWWHTIDLGKYGETDGSQKSILKQIKMPADLTGWSVLDIGTVDGFYAFEAEKRGAKRVLAIDSVAWRGEPFSSHENKTGKQGFNLARKILKSKVEDKEIEVADLTVDSVGKFDLVLCLGILYHMQDPFLVLRNLGKLAKKMIIIETHTDMNFLNLPVMRFYPRNELNNDPTNWWGPNVACINDMLGVSGFVKGATVFKSKYGRTVIHAFKEGVVDDIKEYMGKLEGEKYEKN